MRAAVFGGVPACSPDYRSKKSRFVLLEAANATDWKMSFFHFLRIRVVLQQRKQTALIFTVADDSYALSLLRVVGKVSGFCFRPSFQDYPLVC